MHDWTRLFLVIAIVTMTVFMLHALLGTPLPAAGKDVLLILVGVVASRFGSVYDFYFGSSAGSKEKTDIINSSRAGTAPDTPPANDGAPE
jgi:hypothetical protein